MNNPFLISGYLSPTYFCDRENETALLIHALQNERNVTLIAPRRMGKTGLIKNVFYHLQQNPEIHVFYMDIFSTRNLRDFVSLLANTVLGKLDSNMQKAMQRVTSCIKSCHPTFTFNENTGIPKVSLEIIDNKESITLKEIFDYLQSYNQTCYLAIDEFQQVINYPEKEIEALLRSYIQFIPNVHFIFSGSRRHLMQEMFLSTERPLYQSTQLVDIDAIDLQHYYQFANHFFTDRHIDFPESIFTNIYHAFDGHTWYMQMILNRLYEYKKDVDTKQYDEVLENLIAENEFSYQTLLANLPPNSVSLLKAIAKEGKIKAITSNSFIKKYDLKAASSVSRALKYLLDHELIYKIGEDYTLSDHFMSLWIKKLPF